MLKIKDLLCTLLLFVPAVYSNNQLKDEESSEVSVDEREALYDGLQKAFENNEWAAYNQCKEKLIHLIESKQLYGDHTLLMAASFGDQELVDVAQGYMEFEVDQKKMNLILRRLSIKSANKYCMDEEISDKCPHIINFLSNLFFAE